MPCSYFIDKERRLVISTGCDRVTFQEMRAHENQLRSDPDFDPEFSHLIDATNATVLDISIDEAKTLAGRAVFSPASRIAWVATDPAIYGMGRLIATYNEMGKRPSQVCVFYDLPSALNWFGLEALPEQIETKDAKKVESTQTLKTGRIA